MNNKTSFRKDSQDDGRVSLEEILPNLSEEEQKKLLQIANKWKIRPNDPMFLAIMVITEAREAIIPVPEKLEQIQRNLTLFNTRIETNLIELKDATQNLSIQQYGNLESYTPGDNYKFLAIIREVAFRAALFGTAVGGIFLLALVTLLSWFR